MSYRVEITEQADADLRGIFAYIAFELKSRQNAMGQLNRLEESIYSLDSMPERFRAYDKEPWRGKGLRVMPVNNYLVFYIPDAETKTVKVMRVMYGGRDVDAQLDRLATT